MTRTNRNRSIVALLRIRAFSNGSHWQLSRRVHVQTICCRKNESKFRYKQRRLNIKKIIERKSLWRGVHQKNTNKIDAIVTHKSFYSNFQISIASCFDKAMLFSIPLNIFDDQFVRNVMLLQECDETIMCIRRHHNTAGLSFL